MTIKNIYLFVIVFTCFSCVQSIERKIPEKITSEESTTEINALVNTWHLAAANANYDKYFNLMAENSVFIGTDPTENWNKQEFMEWSKPYFDSGKAWDFSSLERNIFFGETGEIAWFDELLNTQMGICRGSGVATLENGSWKIKHYVLSIAVPNENVEELTNLKKDFDKKFISEVKK